MTELDEMEKINAKLSTAVEEVTLEHYKKNEVVSVGFLMMGASSVCATCSLIYLWSLTLLKPNFFYVLETF